ncbi:protein kinase superfamily [Sarracenia purpurea var. burkii]
MTHGFVVSRESPKIGVSVVEGSESLWLRRQFWSQNHPMQRGFGGRGSGGEWSFRAPFRLVDLRALLEFELPQPIEELLGLQSFAQGLFQWIEVEVGSVDLSYNKISGQDVVPWLLSGGCGDLRYLSLRGNIVSGGIPVLDCGALEYLDLSANNFTSGFPSFRDCSSLQHLDLSSNKFSGDAGASLSTCKSITFSNLTNNQLTGAVPSIPGDDMQFLYLSGNHFHGEIPPCLAASLCSTVVVLDLSLNNLSCTVPKSLGACSSLESLDLSNNNFSGELLIDTLLRMGSLKNVSLAFNNFLGAQPDSFSNMTNLESLNLSSNSLSGLIPPGICQNPRNSLKILDLQNNMLSGTIPASLSNCCQLVSLDVSFNLFELHNRSSCKLEYPFNNTKIKILC